MDSGAAHIAAAVNIPVIVIFGPTNDFLYKPIGKNVKVIHLADSAVPCRPCFQVKCVNPIYKKCLEDVLVKNVMNETVKH